MRRLLLASAGALLVCSCGGAKEVKPTPWAEGKEVHEGEVFALSDQHLALFDPRRPAADGLTLRVTPATTFVSGGREVQRGEIEEGTPVRVYYEPGDEPLATRVEVLDGGAD